MFRGIEGFEEWYGAPAHSCSKMAKDFYIWVRRYIRASIRNPTK
jgi:hypothetical protein